MEYVVKDVRELNVSSCDFYVSVNYLSSRVEGTVSNFLKRVDCDLNACNDIHA